MRVLVTRPIDDAQIFAEALRRAGYEPVVSPALVMTREPGPEIDLAPFQAVLITSANAIRALAARTPQRGAKLICVGPASAEAARHAGFTAVAESQGEGVLGLLTTARASLDSKAGPLFYPSARNVAGALETDLKDAGFSVVRAIVYRMDLAARLTAEAESALGKTELHAVTYFSARSVQGAHQAARESKCLDQLLTLPAICLSEAVKAEAQTHHRHVVAAPVATEAGMLQALDRARRSGL
jgi:uroporphyrinogen-III synthase